MTSAEPCAMCFGAIPWSGVCRLITAARHEDVRNIGFDEGAKVNDWRAELETRGIETICDVKRDAAVNVLSQYAEQGGIIYNSHVSQQHSPE